MDKKGMRDISAKSDTLRKATAEATVRMQPETMQMLHEGRAPKGDPLPHARIAAIMGAKKTWEMIPYCHPLLIDCVSVDFEFQGNELRIQVDVTAVAKTGVEMEAMAGASVAALTIYDMLKPVDKTMEILGCRLLEKRGGKSQLPTAPADLKAAALVVSDSVSAGTRHDESGKAIVARLEQLGVAGVELKVVADERPAISEALVSLCDAGFQLIFTTGGTGLSPRDVTAEATRDVIERETPGIMENLRAYGQRRTPYAMLSQGVAGTRGQALIVNLPGSKSGVEDGLSALLPALFHAFPVMKGAGHEG